MNTTRYLANAAAGITLALLAGCGGGEGGGEGGGVSAVVYSGNTSPAVVTTANASTITANVMGGADSAEIIGGASAESSNATQNRGTGPADFATRLGRNLRDVVARTRRASDSQQVLTAVIPINITEPCPGGGSITLSGTLADDGT